MDLSLSLLHAYICEATLSTKVETTCSLKVSRWEELEFFSSRDPSKKQMCSLLPIYFQSSWRLKSLLLESILNSTLYQGGNEKK